MSNETLTLIFSLVTGILTFVSAIVATSMQNKRNKEEIVTERDKTAVQYRLEFGKLEKDVEDTLWVRVKDEIGRLGAEITRLEQQVSEERTKRLELEQQLVDERVKRRDLEARLAKLVNENAKMTGMVEALNIDKQRVEQENNALRGRIQELERRMGTGPLPAPSD